jgi:ABC-2 type transport system permease protein
MNDHQRWRDLIPFYVSGSISDADRRALEIHLAGCPNCRAEADLWRSVAREVESSPAIAAAPVSPLDRALAQIERDRRRVHSNRLRLAFDLILGQAALLRPEIWISVAAVMGLCLAASLINGSSEALRFIGPLIAAASLAVIGGPQNDPAIELAQSTPVSPGKIILARATLVFGYNLVLSAAAGLLLGAVLPKETFFSLVRDGLSPSFALHRDGKRRSRRLRRLDPAAPSGRAGSTNRRNVGCPHPRRTRRGLSVRLGTPDPPLYPGRGLDAGGDMAGRPPRHRQPIPGENTLMKNFLGIFRYEYRMMIDRRGPWLAYALVFVFHSLTLIRLGNTAASPFAGLGPWSAAGEILYVLNLFTPLIGGIAAADRLIRDGRLGVRELQRSAPLNPGTILLGKYAGVLAGALTPNLLFVLALGAWTVLTGAQAPIFLAASLTTFVAITIPAYAFVIAFSLACPLFMPIRVYQVLFTGYWFWGNYLPPEVFPTLNGTLLTPAGVYALHGFFHGKVGAAKGIAYSSGAAIANLIVIAAAAFVALAVAGRITARREIES